MYPYLQFPYRDYRLMPSDFYYSPYSEGWSIWDNGAPEFFDERHRLPSQQRLTFVLIHGSWADAHFWDGVAAELRSRGHFVYTPEYAGHGKDPNEKVTHTMIPKSVVDFITKWNLRTLFLLGTVSEEQSSKRLQSKYQIA